MVIDQARCQPETPSTEPAGYPFGVRIYAYTHSGYYSVFLSRIYNRSPGANQLKQKLNNCFGSLLKEIDGVFGINTSSPGVYEPYTSWEDARAVVVRIDIFRTRRFDAPHIKLYTYLCKYSHIELNEKYINLYKFYIDAYVQVFIWYA